MLGILVIIITTATGSCIDEATGPVVGGLDINTLMKVCTEEEIKAENALKKLAEADTQLISKPNKEEEPVGS